MYEETFQVIVRRRQEQGKDIIVVDLARPDGGELPPFEAGAHVDLYLNNGLVRQYSLASRPSDRHVYRLGILRDPASRGGSIAAHACLIEGAIVRIGTPRNNFPLVSNAKRSVLVGGGIGITPLIAMAWSLHDTAANFELHYCSRSRSACAFLDELAASPFAARVHLHFDDEPSNQQLNLATVLAGADVDTHIYTCGPKGFMDWVIGEARRLGIPDRNIHKEYFQADTNTDGAAFDVIAKKSGKKVRVAEGQSIVDALATVGIKVNVSCKQGVCGSCLCTVLEGEPDHRDVFLTDEERAANDQILLCCSRAKTPYLVLDI
ncbi:PDR/VanB family oxidoreductase [Tepidiphilus sp. HLB4]